ncbi:MAG: coproporphyrinogen III oxidase family protein [Thermoanaerobaculia bacterium]|nr:coproporphyrinogen III oxidase family protein [Thermoanaerobaculia bacterium]
MTSSSTNTIAKSKNVAEAPEGLDVVARPEPATAGIDSPETDVGSVFVSNYPPYSAWGEEAAPAVERALAEPARPDTPLGLYLHIPFCRKRCKFCYFRVYTDKNFDEIGSYVEALCREIEALAKHTAVAGRPLKFVYFGGGTPSFLSVKHLEELASRVQAVMPWTGVEEVAFECEPGTLTRSKLEAIRGIGVTRLSLGIENFDDEVLRENGRAHVSKEIWRCLPWIEDLGFEQLNIDLIAGMVGENWDAWRETVAKTVDLAPDSVTVYQLELPFNTGYAKGLMDGSLKFPLADWDLKRAWHRYAFEQLAEAGYHPSSAYTMVKEPDQRFVYRDSVWQGCDLLGTGVASFSHLSGVHFQNADGWGEYLALATQGRSTVARAFETTADDRLIREFILQLKLGQLATAPFAEKFGVDVTDHFSEPLTALQGEGLLTVSEDQIQLSIEGLLRVDSLLPRFYAAQYRGARYT